MARTATTARKYGKQSKKSKAERLFAELPQSPVRKPVAQPVDGAVGCLTSQLASIQLEEELKPRRKSARRAKTEDSVVVVEVHEEPKVVEEKQEEECCQLEDKAEEPSTTGALEEESPWDKTPADEIPTNEPQESAIKDDEPEAKPEEPSTTEAPTEESPSDNVPADEVLTNELQETAIKDDELEANPEEATPSPEDESSLRVLTWEDVCPSGDRIDKIAEASFAEVYRVTNDRGMSIIKVIRLHSPIKAQTKAQVRSGLVDEEPHAEEDVNGELQISEWLADIPGFVVYKERYIVQGKTTKQLLETHQAFQKKMKKEDPRRAQFYPSPSRYLDDTKFLVVELGDAGIALEDWQLTSENQLWDIFLLEAIALARAEELAMFEHRDLHEGNICIKQVRPPREREPKAGGFFGYSGLEITILDYGLSRAEDLSIDDAKPVAFDLERDLSLFTSTHAAQCKVYRQMRSFLLRADRKCLPPEAHDTPYAKGIDGPLSWDAYAPYSNVLWLAYLYEYLVGNFKGNKRELTRFKKETAELWTYLNPDAAEHVPCFGCAADVVCFALEAGWVREEQLQGSSASMLEG